MVNCWVQLNADVAFSEFNHWRFWGCEYYDPIKDAFQKSFELQFLLIYILRTRRLIIEVKISNLFLIVGLINTYALIHVSFRGAMDIGTRARAKHKLSCNTVILTMWYWVDDIWAVPTRFLQRKLRFNGVLQATRMRSPQIQDIYMCAGFKLATRMIVES